MNQFKRPAICCHLHATPQITLPPTSQPSQQKLHFQVEVTTAEAMRKKLKKPKSQELGTPRSFNIISALKMCPPTFHPRPPDAQSVKSKGSFSRRTESWVTKVAPVASSWFPL